MMNFPRSLALRGIFCVTVRNSHLQYHPILVLHLVHDERTFQ